MKPSEKEVLDTLRKTTLAYLSESDYAQIEKAVEQQGILHLTGTALAIVKSAVQKAVSVKTGDMVSWNSSGGRASGKVVRVITSGKINVPDSSFTIQGTEDDPAALIQLYRDGKPTDTKVGHKVSTLNKSLVQKHGGGSHDQRSHGAWAGNGYGDGKFIQDREKAPDMTATEAKARISEIESKIARVQEYQDRVKSAKTKEEIRAIRDEFKSGKESPSGSKKSGGVDSMTQRSLDRGKKALEGRNYKTMMADYDKMESTWRKKTYKPFDVENGGGGDPQDLAQTDFYRKYGASVMDVQMYAEARNSNLDVNYPRFADVKSNPFTMGSYGESWGN